MNEFKKKNKNIINFNDTIHFIKYFNVVFIKKFNQNFFFICLFKIIKIYIKQILFNNYKFQLLQKRKKKKQFIILNYNYKKIKKKSS